MTHGELYLSILRGIVQPAEDRTFLDLCCGEMTHTRDLKFGASVHVDVVDWPNRPKEFHFVQSNVLDCEFEARAFDVSLCSDGIEHFTKADGWRLIHAMEEWSARPVIFTPLGNYLVDAAATNPDTHKSGWWPEEFTKIGWKTDVYKDWHPTLGIGAFFAWRE